MASNSFGNFFRITTWGESHGKAVGVVIDGVPAGVTIKTKVINEHLAWRRPGQYLTSPRQEQDIAEIVSGIFDGISTGAPIAIIIRNNDAKKSQYAAIKDVLRPGHANFTYLQKYGVFDHNGGGRASARETAVRVAAGAVAAQVLATTGINIYAYLSAVGNIKLAEEYNPSDTDLANIALSPVYCPHAATSAAIVSEITAVKQAGNSIGGMVDFVIKGAPAGLGDPMYHKLEAQLAYAMLSIPASKGFSIGSGFSASSKLGNEHNDLWQQNSAGEPEQTSNNCGGILGGISTGADIYGKVAFKPTSSIKMPQTTLDTDGNVTTYTLSKATRHDPCVAVRAVAVVRAMCWLTIADSYLGNKMAKITNA